jgi:protein SCO1/2
VFRSPAIWSFLALLALACPLRAAIVETNSDRPDVLGTVPEFKLTDQSGATVTREDLLGKVWVASFVLVRCPDGKCPQVTQTVKRIQDDLAGRPDLLFVTFTVDPEHDDPQELNRYAERNGADPKRWLFLTGSEKTIANLLRAFYFPTRDQGKGPIPHSQKLILVDRQGRIRAPYYEGMPLPPPFSEADFDANVRKLERKVDELLAPELPSYFPKDFPLFNAALNGLSGVLLLAGWVAVRNRFIRLHITCMLSALAVSALFLAAYLFYHIVVKEGRPTRFADQAPGAPPWMQYVYLTILGTHTLLAVFVAPLALYTAYLGLRGRLWRHVAIARWTMPMWLYVSVTGVVVYWMLYRLYPPT